MPAKEVVVTKCRRTFQDNGVMALELISGQRNGVYIARSKYACVEPIANFQFQVEQMYKDARRSQGRDKALNVADGDVARPNLPWRRDKCHLSQKRISSRHMTENQLLQYQRTNAPLELELLNAFTIFPYD